MTENGIPSIRTPNIGKGRLILENVNRVDEKTYQLWTKRGIPEYRDLILAREAPVGNVAIVTKNLKVCLGQRTVLIKPKHNLVCSEFLNYLLNSHALNEHLISLSNGATVGHLNVTEIRNLKLPNLPPLPIQKKIAAILSAYDDLIEKNNRRISILEKMAEELYKEWFVRLRFPGHEKTKIKNGIPEGWEVKAVEEAFEYTGGGTPSTSIKAYWEEGNINWYSPTDITANNSYFIFESKGKITELGLKESSAKLFPAYSIMLTSRATIGELGINVTPSCTNQGFITCVPNEKLPLYYLFYWLKLNKELFIQLANGATFLEITKGKFKKIPIIIPNSYIMNKYNIVQEPFFSQIQNLQSAISNLTSTRDRLLSRLLSGKIDVENLDIKFPDSMREDS